MNAVLEQSEAAILDRAFDPAAGWSPAAAQAILGMNFNPQDRENMIVLLEKAKDGILTSGCSIRGWISGTSISDDSKPT